MSHHLCAITLVLLGAVALSAGGTTGCGDNVCKQSDQIIRECTPPAASSTQPQTVDATKRSCTDENEKEARCIVDNKDAFCTYLKNTTAADPNNAYLKCMAAGD